MLQSQRIAVVIPAYNEAPLIERTLAGIPAYIDLVVVVDDASQDNTSLQVGASPDSRVRLARHTHNRGVGGAILTGYGLAHAAGMDIAVVMAGDGQMHPDDMPNLLLPLLRGEADYVKGTRLGWPGARGLIPATRYVGIRALELLTRWTTGLDDLSDFQCGYTALRLAVLERIDCARVYPRYGFPNDFISHLAAAGVPIAERIVRPIYGSERSDLRPHRVIVPLLGILARAWRRQYAGRPVALPSTELVSPRLERVV